MWKHAIFFLRQYLLNKIFADLLAKIRVFSIFMLKYDIFDFFFDRNIMFILKNTLIFILNDIY